MTCVIPSQSHIFSLFLMPVGQCIVAQWRHISSESAVVLLLHLCSICSHILIFVAKCDAQLKAWDILLVLTSVAGNLCNKCPSGYSNKTAVKVILSMRSLVSIEQQSPRRPCDINLTTFTLCSNQMNRTTLNLFKQEIKFQITAGATVRTKNR